MKFWKPRKNLQRNLAPLTNCVPKLKKKSSNLLIKTDNSGLPSRSFILDCGQTVASRIHQNVFLLWKVAGVHDGQQLREYRWTKKEIRGLQKKN